MFFNKHKGKIIDLKLTKAEREALNKVIYDSMIASDKVYRDQIDALVLWTLHVKYGFGVKRLRSFWEDIAKEHNALMKYYEMPDDDGWLCVEKLKQIGVDVHQWNEEREANIEKSGA